MERLKSRKFFVAVMGIVGGIFISYFDDRYITFYEYRTVIQPIGLLYIVVEGIIDTVKAWRGE